MGFPILINKRNIDNKYMFFRMVILMIVNLVLSIFYSNQYKKQIILNNIAMMFCSKENLPKWLVNRALCHFMLGDNQSTLMDTKKALEHDINYEKAYEQLMDVYFRVYDLEAIERVINILETINLNNEILMYAKGLCSYFKNIEKQLEEFGRKKDFKNAILVVNSVLEVTDKHNIEHFKLLKIKYTCELEKLNEVCVNFHQSFNFH